MKAVVTGASSLLGKELCSFLKKKGYFLIASKNKSSLQDVDKEIVADLSTKKGTSHFCSLIEDEGPFDLIINNFGPLLVKPLLQTTIQELEEQYQVNCFTPFTIVQRLYPHVKGGGSIINMGLCGLHHQKANTYFPIYKSAKHTLYYLTKCFAKELIEKNIRINMISPGYLQDSKDMPSCLSNLPLKSLTSFEEILKTVDYLIHSSITGQNIEVAGGVGL